MKQVWHDLLFAHWPVPAATLRPLLPAQLELDTFSGECWIGVAPFHMSGIHAHGLPALPGLSRFPELNVRTYVTMDGKPGVYFFSLDAANLPAVWAARTFYHLPYFHSRMSIVEGGGWFQYFSKRHGSQAEFRGRYRPTSPIALRPPGSLPHWLTERYCLYTVAGKNIYRADIHHMQWPLQDAELDVELNTMAQAAGIALPPTLPLLYY